MDIAGIGKKLAKDLWPVLEGELNRLEVEEGEMRTRARGLLVLQAEVLLLRLAGEDTTIGDQAIASSIQSLRAAGAIAVVSTIRELVASVVRKALVATLPLL